VHHIIIYIVVLNVLSPDVTTVV